MYGAMAIFVAEERGIRRQREAEGDRKTHPIGAGDDAGAMGTPIEERPVTSRNMR